VGLGYLAAVSFALTGLLFLLLPLTSEPRIRDTAQPGMILVTFGEDGGARVPLRAWRAALSCLGMVARHGPLALAALTCVYALLRPPADTNAASVRIGALFFLAIHAVFLRYFLARRRDFGVGT